MDGTPIHRVAIGGGVVVALLFIIIGPALVFYLTRSKYCNLQIIYYIHNKIPKRNGSLKNENSVNYSPQTCMGFLYLLNTKEDILKNVDNQTVSGPCLLP